MCRICGSHGKSGLVPVLAALSGGMQPYLGSSRQSIVADLCFMQSYCRRSFHLATYYKRNESVRVSRKSGLFPVLAGLSGGMQPYHGSSRQSIVADLCFMQSCCRRSSHLASYYRRVDSHDRIVACLKPSLFECALRVCVALRHSSACLERSGTMM